MLWSAAQAAGGLFTGYVQFLWSRVALGVFESPAFPASVRTVANLFHPEDRGRPTGLYTIGGDVGRLVGTPLLTALLLAFGWRTMFVAMGVVGLLGAVGWFALYRDPDLSKMPPNDRAYLAANKVGERSPVTVASWRRLFRYRSMWGMILGAFCSGYAIWMYGTWLPGYLEMQHHVSIAKTGLLAMIPLACSIAGSLIGGFVDRPAGAWRPERGRQPQAAGRRSATSPSAVFCAIAAYSTELDTALTCISASMFFLSFAQSGKWTLDHRHRAAILFGLGRFHPELRILHRRHPVAVADRDGGGCDRLLLARALDRLGRDGCGRGAVYDRGARPDPARGTRPRTCP